jgi:tetratricopeptide (TPR) repeat protein
MRARKLVIGSGLLLAVATSVPALAQTNGGAPYPAACANVPPSESERAHVIYQAGKVQYDDKNYDAAIQQFRDAYVRDCSKHDLLIIISRAYELKGDRVEALKALELYLERVPNSPDAPTHRKGIEQLKRQIAAAPPPPPTATAPAPTSSAPPPAEVREHTVAPWIVVGLGGAGVVTGIVLLAAAKIPDNCDASSGSCKPTPGESTKQLDDDRSTAGTAKGLKTGGVVTLIGGAVILTGGLLWHFLEPTGPVEKTGKIKPVVTPAVAPGYAGMSLGGSF